VSLLGRWNWWPGKLTEMDFALARESASTTTENGDGNAAGATEPGRSPTPTPTLE
jgi:uncharacterized membrane protein YdfJ with MMPL/SSD domain